MPAYKDCQTLYLRVRRKSVCGHPVSTEAGGHCFPFSETSLLGNAKEHGQTPLNLHRCINTNAPEGWPQLIALHGHDPVHHDLRRLWTLSSVETTGSLTEGKPRKRIEPSRSTADRLSFLYNKFVVFRYSSAQIVYVLRYTTKLTYIKRARRLTPCANLII